MKVAIIGASGAIGNAFLKLFAAEDKTEHIYAFSRSPQTSDAANISHHLIALEDEDTIAHAAHIASLQGPLDYVIVATGLLHDHQLKPEKALKDLSALALERLFAVNTIGPALVAKHFLPLLHRQQRAIFATLSARIGSISDNALGGWYGYRAAKAALNMLIKTASIEMARQHHHMIIVGMHPGTVDSRLSKPFQGNVPPGKLFTPDYAAQQMLAVLKRLTPSDSGKCVAYDGTIIQP